MNSGDKGFLIHYIMVDAGFRFKNVGTAMIKMIMSPKDYCDRKVMSVTYLPKNYSEIIKRSRNDEFFKSSHLKVM